MLVNNAGISRVIPHADLSASTRDIWQELHEVNVVAPFRLVAHAEPALRDAAARGKPDLSLMSVRMQASDQRVRPFLMQRRRPR